MTKDKRMMIEHGSTRYLCTFGSDLVRDGVYLEVGNGISDDNPLMEIFYADQTKAMSVSLFTHDIPIEILEAAIKITKVRLTPSGDTA